MRYLMLLSAWFATFHIGGKRLSAFTREWKTFLACAVLIVLATSSLLVGPHNIVASYSGSSVYDPSSASLTETILSTQALTPVFTPGSGSYASGQKVVISDSTPGATIYYTTDGTVPTLHSAVYTGPVIVTASGALNAIAVAPGYSNSAEGSAFYTLPGASCTAIDDSGGFTGAGLSLNGGASIRAGALQLTDGGLNEARSAFTNMRVPVESFSTDFTFQLNDAIAEGFTFTMRGDYPGIIGLGGGGLGYEGIGSSAAIKFDLFDTAGEGYDSTGLYVNGAAPTTNALDLSQAGIDLHSGHIFTAHVDYINGVATGVIADTSTGVSASKVLEGYVATPGEQAYVGFTAATGATYSATQNILAWRYQGGTGCAAPPTSSAKTAGKSTLKP